MEAGDDCSSGAVESKSGLVLGNVAEVVEKILTFVPTKSVFRHASVCRLWRNCARRVLRTRQKVTWISASGSSQYEEHILLRTMEEELEVVLLFGYDAYKTGAARFLNQLLEPLGQSNVLIAGGHVEKVFPYKRDCGPRIQGASVLMDQDVSTPASAEVTIRRLKAANIPERNTVGFMFACVARGHNHYNNQHNVEADVFHKLFPGVPLFGFFGNGEIGCDRIVKENYTLSQTDANGLQHGYTTVMSLVHLG
ncbi:F-box only protein 22 [Bagarius yarrelli]|uniref:F-box only protein 22 n=1 Tax=Bagarius yarrelli TaxID=175774 RepID=A0A556VWL4_BAGYA|nr:F-box only protein 22 [Bagarius yarrelli]